MGRGRPDRPGGRCDDVVPAVDEADLEARQDGDGRLRQRPHVVALHTGRDDGGRRPAELRADERVGTGVALREDDVAPAPVAARAEARHQDEDDDEPEDGVGEASSPAHGDASPQHARRHHPRTATRHHNTRDVITGGRRHVTTTREASSLTDSDMSPPHARHHHWLMVSRQHNTRGVITGGQRHVITTHEASSLADSNTSPQHARRHHWRTATRHHNTRGVITGRQRHVTTTREASSLADGVTSLQPQVALQAGISLVYALTVGFSLVEL